MNWTGRVRLLGCATTLLVLAACGTTSSPNDVSEGVGFQDYQQYQARRAALRNATPQTVLPPADVTADPLAPPLPGAVARGPGPAQATGPTDVASIAAAAIAEAERVPPTGPAQPAIAAGGDDFVAPPLPEGMVVLGANVVAFALSTSHPVGQRVYPRFNLRLGRPEVRCGDFRTTDLAQDWFLENEGPERDRAGLDPDGDGFACNWDPERYRAQARAAAIPDPLDFPSGQAPGGFPATDG
jgi:hypothetical protein